MSAFVLYSDGGGIKEQAAAGACIVERKSDGARFHFVAFLGGGTNNEGEIVGGLLGFAALNHLAYPTGEAPVDIRWVCDSEYVLKSATEYIHGWQRNGWKTAAKAPVKNQGLWQTYLTLARGLKIKREHVRGHTGHEENELCDTASTWMQTHGSDLWKEASSIPIAEISGQEWFCLDIRDLMDEAREGVDISEELSGRVQAALGSTTLSRVVAGRRKSTKSAVTMLRRAILELEEQGQDGAIEHIQRAISLLK